MGWYRISNSQYNLLTNAKERQCRSSLRAKYPGLFLFYTLVKLWILYICVLAYIANSGLFYFKVSERQGLEFVSSSTPPIKNFQIATFRRVVFSSKSYPLVKFCIYYLILILLFKCLPGILSYNSSWNFIEVSVSLGDTRSRKSTSNYLNTNWYTVVTFYNY